ncbi:MAG: tetratricopeptide repeat protein [Victivallaceae bacterium]|jgi:tetratricopeptide (TPR) repeat protein
MDKKNLQDVQTSMREMFQRAVESGRKNNLDYAIEILKDLLRKSPGLIPAREKLREFERIKSDKISPVGRMITNLKSSLQAAKIKAAISQKPLDAMMMCEGVLAHNLYNPLVLNLLADASLKADAPFIGVEALSILRELKPRNETNLRKLADFYRKCGDAMSALKIVQEIAAKHPKDLGVQAEMRSAVALASMQQGDWQKEGKTQDKVKDKEEGMVSELLSGTLHDIDQMKTVIAKLEKDLEEGESVDARKKLGELYHACGRFDEAIEQYTRVAKGIGAMDPAVDKSIEKSNLSKMDVEINALSADPANADKVEELKKNRYNYQLERATERVNTYPNDNQLRFDLAILYFNGNFIDNAIEQFQYARKNLQRKVTCMVYLGRCFLMKNQYDMAIEQLTSALTEMLVMDKGKKEALYYLGKTYEAAGNAEKALESFKEIYQADVNYLDVGKKVQDYYNNKRNG